MQAIVVGEIGSSGNVRARQIDLLGCEVEAEIVTQGLFHL